MREIVGRPTGREELCASAYNNIGANAMQTDGPSLYFPPPSPPYSPSVHTANTPPCFPFRLLRMRLNFFSFSHRVEWDPPIFSNKGNERNLLFLPLFQVS